MAVTVTNKAWEKIKSNVPILLNISCKAGLRIKVIGGGCSGLQYDMGWDMERAGDKKIEKYGDMVIIDPKSFIYLNGTEIDFKEGVMQSGFVLNNPNVEHGCGCGQSFSPKINKTDNEKQS